MSLLVYADFTTQAAAAAAMDRMEAQGVPHADMALQYGENIGRSAATSSSPTSVVSPVSNHDAKEISKDGRVALRTPTRIPDPAHIGACTVAVLCGDSEAASRFSALLREQGGTDVHTALGDFVADADALSPPHDTADAADVERAIEASRGGASLPRH